MGGGGEHTGSNNIVMAFSPQNIVVVCLKNDLQRGGGGGHGHPMTLLAQEIRVTTSLILKSFRPRVKP